MYANSMIELWLKTELIHIPLIAETYFKKGTELDNDLGFRIFRPSVYQIIELNIFGVF